MEKNSWLGCGYVGPNSWRNLDLPLFTHRAVFQVQWAWVLSEEARRGLRDCGLRSWQKCWLATAPRVPSQHEHLRKRGAKTCDPQRNYNLDSQVSRKARMSLMVWLCDSCAQRFPPWRRIRKWTTQAKSWCGKWLQRSLTPLWRKNSQLRDKEREAKRDQTSDLSVVSRDWTGNQLSWF